jgi:hypothetical protein
VECGSSTNSGSVYDTPLSSSQNGVDAHEAYKVIIRRTGVGVTRWLLCSGLRWNFYNRGCWNSMGF